MGVSGSGKTTVGELLAARTGWPFLDADTLHSAEHIAQMEAGIPLTDDQRWPWLGRIASWIGERYAAGEPGVVACSALRRAYRDHLREADPDLRLVYLRVDRAVVADRLSDRRGHFFPASLVDAQLAVLDEPTADEQPIIIHSGQPPEEVDAVLANLTG
jgi:gluconokinase